VCVKYGKFVLAIAFLMLIAIICIYIRWQKPRGPKPGLIDSGIAAVEGRMYVGELLFHWFPITANDKDNPDVIKQLSAVLSSPLWGRLDNSSRVGFASLKLTLHNGKTVGVVCSGTSNTSVISIEGSEYLVNNGQLQSALDALLKASLAKWPEGDTIALTDNILAVDGGFVWPLGKNAKGYVVSFSTDKDPTEIAEFERALSQRKPCHYRADAVVADLYVSLRDNTRLFVETYQGGQVIIMKQDAKAASLNNIDGHCSEVDPAKLAAVYSLWLPKAECCAVGN